jgi:hypothetical protein
VLSEEPDQRCNQICRQLRKSAEQAENSSRRRPYSDAFLSKTNSPEAGAKSNGCKIKLIVDHFSTYASFFS